MNTNRFRGFTLIELLVVIAIIGILSAVVLASLNSARDKGANAAIKANLANARAEAELFYDTGSTYDAACATTGTNVIGDNILAAATAGGATYSAGDTTVPSATVAACHDSASAWAAAAPLKGGNYFCVDSVGTGKQVTTALTSGATVCPAS